MSEFAPYVKALEASELRERVLREQLIATQAREAKLQFLIGYLSKLRLEENETYKGSSLHEDVEKILATTDDTALKERLKAERERCAERLEAVDGEWITKVAASALIRSMT